MNKKIIAFLDLLGFTNYITNDPEGALKLLENSCSILKLKLLSERISKRRFHQNNQGDTAKIDSFESYYPMSDSIFIVASDANKFIEQISVFLITCLEFTINSIRYPENKNNPIEVTEKIFSIKNGKVSKDELKKNWYPTLFRGGISYGELLAYETVAIHDSSSYKSYNLAGSAVINAIKLEKFDKGPRLFCDKDFYNLLDLEKQKLVVCVRVEDRSSYEILWPAFYYLNNVPDIEIYEVNGLLEPAVNLYMHYKDNSEICLHYRNFIDLIIRSTIKHFETYSYKEQAEKYILNFLKKKQIDYPFSESL